MAAFVEEIEDPDFKTVRQLLENYLLEIDHGDRTTNVKEFTNMVESHQRGHNRMADKDMEVKSRCVKFNKNVGQPKSENNLRTALQIPNDLFGSFLSRQKKAFLWWKNATVKGESVPNEEVIKILKMEDGDNS
eukprot:2297061-Ditylum_brightwellii.AAC.2